MKTILGKQPEFGINIFFGNCPLRKLVLQIVVTDNFLQIGVVDHFFQMLQIVLRHFSMFIVDRLYQIWQFVVPIVVFQDTFFCKRPECFGITARYCSIF